MRRRETPTDYARPHRPLPVRLADGAARLARTPGPFAPLDVDELMARARGTARLDDYGDEWFVGALRALAESINAEACLTPVGMAIARRRLQAALVTRLRAEALLRRHPEIAERNIGHVLLVTGLQRTGTTTLQRLIAADPAVRAVLSWEALNPVPLPGDRGDRRRKRQARLAARVLGYLSPAFQAVHPVAPDAPEEDILLLDVSFMSQSPEATMHVPGYAAWLERQDHARAYAYWHRLLQILDWQRPGTVRVLKTPNHLEHLDLILRQLPQATVVQTHRDPRVAVISFCSMVAHGRGLLSDRVDPRAIGAHWVPRIRRMVARASEARDGAGDARFVDVSYPDLLDDPIAELRRIYDAAGLPLGDEALRRARAVVAANRQHRYGRHVYTAASFGLDPDAIDRWFEGYRERYGVETERAR